MISKGVIGAVSLVIDDHGEHSPQKRGVLLHRQARHGERNDTLAVGAGLRGVRSRETSIDLLEVVDLPIRCDNDVTALTGKGLSTTLRVDNREAFVGDSVAFVDLIQVEGITRSAIEAYDISTPVRTTVS